MARPGGSNHSTKSKGFDKRKNRFRKAIDEAFTGEEVVKLLRTCLSEGNAGDMQAAKVFLEYTVGKPKQEVEVSNPDGIKLSLSDLVTFSDGKS